MPKLVFDYDDTSFYADLSSAFMDLFTSTDPNVRKTALATVSASCSGIMNNEDSLSNFLLDEEGAHRSVILRFDFDPKSEKFKVSNFGSMDI